MTVPSVLFRNVQDQERAAAAKEPAFFKDLNLDQVCDIVTASKADYSLKPLFYTSLSDVDAVKFRQDAMQDLDRGELSNNIDTFAKEMRSVREHVEQAGKLYYPLQKRRWLLDAVNVYCAAVTRLASALISADLRSEAFLSIRDYLRQYISSANFIRMASEAETVLGNLASVVYAILLKDDSLTVTGYDGEADYGAEVSETFAKFRVGNVKNYAVKFFDSVDMNHVEAAALDFVARLNPEIFQKLSDFVARYITFMDEVVVVFDREVQFYVAYLANLQPFRNAGLAVTYPDISTEDKSVFATAAFDFALASRLNADKKDVVVNDFQLEGEERILVVTGPNQGGKTTFARMFGQIHFLASLGLPVPGLQARLYLFDGLYTHFERQEAVATLRGKLEDDLLRIHNILDQATSSSIIILNEIFTSTSLKDAVTLAARVFDRIERLDSLCVCVTFLDELSSRSSKTVSMVSSVASGNPSERTFKILRRPSDGLAYALSLAQKYRLTYECLKERMGL